MMFFSRLLLVGLLILWAPFLKADWMNLTGAETAPNIAEIYVLDDHVKVKLEVYVGDLDKFEELIPDEWFNNISSDSNGDAGSKRTSLEQRMETFATRRFQLITEEGLKLTASLELVEPRFRVDRLSPFADMINPMTRLRVKDAPTDKRVLYAEIVYPFPGEDKTLKPKQLKIIPPLNDKGDVTASIGFLAYHKSVPIIDFRYLGQPATLNLDWQDPWYTKFDNSNLSRHHKYPLMLYLYVEPRQVRLETLLRISDIKELTGFNAEEPDLSAEQNYRLLQEHIKNYYADKETLEIDGKSFKPDSIRVAFLHATLSGLKVLKNMSAIDEPSLLVGVSQKYYIAKLPQKIESRWQYFNKRVDRIPVIVTDPAGPLSSVINKDDPVFGWQNFLKTYSDPEIRPVNVETGLSVTIPYIGETKLLNQLPDQQEAAGIVEGVLDNVRIAFIEKEPGNFSKILGEVISSKETDVLQSELEKLFSPRVTGGGVGSVQAFNDIQIISMQELNNQDGFSATVSGSAGISAKHWGHIDQRQLRFQLLLDLVDVNNQWRLADITVIDIKDVK